jgi:hypothetical protein
VKLFVKKKKILDSKTSSKGRDILCVPRKGLGQPGGKEIRGKY